MTASPARSATFAMGTRCEVVVLDGEAFAQDACETAIRAVMRLHALWSPYEPSSVISLINRDGHARRIRLDEETWRLLSLCRDAWKKTRGAFDPTVATDSSSWGFGHVELIDAERTVRLHAPIRIDAGAVGKGLALDIAGEALREEGVSRAILHLGTSSVLAIGRNDDADGWRVRVANGGPVVVLHDSAMGVSARTPDDRRRGGHIVNPRTGKGADIGVECACAVGKSAGWCDALSTAMIVDGLPKRIDPVEHHERLDCVDHVDYVDRAWVLRNGAWSAWDRVIEGAEA